MAGFEPTISSSPPTKVLAFLKIFVGVPRIELGLQEPESCVIAFIPYPAHARGGRAEGCALATRPHPANYFFVPNKVFRM